MIDILDRMCGAYDQHLVGWGIPPTVNREAQRSAMRAALLAIREPTSSMLVGDELAFALDEQDPERVWHFMIDKALEE